MQQCRAAPAHQIGAALSLDPKINKVLLIDFDPQGNLSRSLGITDLEFTIYGNLRGDYPIKQIEITKKLHLIPANEDLAASEIELSSETGREFFLKDLLENLRGNYDYILIDCPPSLGLLTVNALTASDEVYIPVKTEFLPVTGLKTLTDVIERLKKRINKNLKIGGIICTQFNMRRTLDKEVVDIIDQQFKDKVFETKIRNNVSLAEAPSVGKHIFTYSSASAGAEDYLNLTKEILARNQ